MGDIRLLSCSPRRGAGWTGSVNDSALCRFATTTSKTLWIRAVPVIVYRDADFQLCCGADWGGSIAWSTAIWYPEVVEKLVTCCGAHPELYFRNMDADQEKRCGEMPPAHTAAFHLR